MTAVTSVTSCRSARATDTQSLSLLAGLTYSPAVASGTAQTAWVRWASVVSALIVCQLFWQVAPASAQGWSGVLTDLSGDAAVGVRDPDVAMDGAGNAIAVWSRFEPPAVQAARYTAGSGAWSGPVNLAPGASSAEHARVAMDSSGNALVVWVEGGGGGNIRAARYLTATGVWTAPVTISDPAMGYVYDAKPHLAVDPAGNALVVWRLTIPRSGFSEYVVQGVGFTAASATWSSPVALGAITRFDTLGDDDLAVAGDRFGNGVAVWKQVSGLQAARYLAGSGWGPAVNLTAPGQSGSRPRVGVDQSGNATVIWADQSGAVRTVRYIAASDGWSSPFDLTATGLTGNLQLVVDGAGNVTAIWAEASLRARRYVAASDEWQATRSVASPGPGDPGPFGEPQLAVDGQGVVTAVWSNNSIIQSARYAPSTDAWSSPVSLSRVNALNYRASHSPRLGADTAGNVVVVWFQTHGGDFTRVIQSTRWQVSGAVNNTVPSGLVAGLVNTQVTLRWVAALGTVTSYVVEAGSSPGAADLAQLDTGSTRPLLQVIAPAGVYYVRVRSRIGGSLGLPSNEIRLTVGSPCTVPAAPANLSNTTASTSVSLSWQAGAGATSYVLEAGSSPGLSDVAALNTGSSATTFSTAAPPGLYYVRIRSQNACGISAPSNETTVTIGCSQPSAPGTLSATVSGSNVALSWGPATGAASYVLEAGSAPGASNLGQFPTASPGLAASAPPGIYYVRVRALSACGSGPASNEVIVTIQ